MEDKKSNKAVHNIFLFFLLLSFFTTSCVTRHDNAVLEWDYVEINDGMKVYYEKENTFPTTCMVYVDRTNSRTFEIGLSKDRRMFIKDYYPVNTNKALKDNVSIRRPCDTEMLTCLESCLSSASRSYNMDSLVSISCSTFDFPDAAVECSRKVKLSAYRDFAEIVPKYLETSSLKYDIDEILKKYKLKVAEFNIDNDGMMFYCGKKEFLENYKLCSSQTVPDSLLFVPLIINIVKI